MRYFFRAKNWDGLNNFSFFYFLETKTLFRTVFPNPLKSKEHLQLIVEIRRVHTVNFQQKYNIKETYKPYTLEGPTVTRLVQDPLAVLRLEN